MGSSTFLGEDLSQEEASETVASADSAVTASFTSEVPAATTRDSGFVPESVGITQIEEEASYLVAVKACLEEGPK